MKPLLAHTYEPHRVSFPCYIQPKLNGVRALYQDGYFQSRDELPWNVAILQHLADELVEIIPNRQILDGELYVHGWPLQKINGAVTPVRLECREDTAFVEYHIFDTVDFTSSFADRWNSLPHGIELNRIRFVETRRISGFVEADAFYSEKVSQGYEGIMYRLGDCPYTLPKQPFYEHALGAGTFPSKARFLSDKDNRCWHLLKRKDWQDGEWPIVDYRRTIGEKGEPGFQLTLKTKDGLLFNCGAGLSHSKQDYYEQNSPAGRLAKLKYLTLSKDGIPQNNTLLAIL